MAMEPNLGVFKELLQQDKTFRDYFNAFLNLPVFAKRLLYDTTTRSFRVDPPLKSTYCVLNDVQLMDWVYSNRLSLFWCSEFLYEYKLCHALTEDIPAKWLDSFTGVSAMHYFRKSLFNTVGECACLFWVDAERLKHTTDSDHSLQLVLWIQDTYLSNGAKFSLGEELMQKLLTSCNLHDELSATERTEIILAAQKIVLQSLKGYWCSRYILHLQEEKVNASTLKKIEEAEDNKLTKHHSENHHLPRIITDEGMYRADKQTETAAHIKLSSPYRLPSISRRGSVLGQAESSDVITHHTRNDVSLLLTPSTQDMFAKCVEFELAKADHVEKQDGFKVLPYLTASLRADSLAGSPMLRYWKNMLRKPEAINYLLFWVSVENILTKDEMRRWYNKFSQSDCKKCPYISCFEEHPTAINLDDLLALFVRKTAQHCVKLPANVRKELSQLLPKGLGQSLLVHAQTLAEKYLIKPWQKYLLHDYEHFMKSCTVQKFQARLTSSYRKGHSNPALSSSLLVDQVAEETFSASSLECMWTALRLAEAAKYPGINQLPSRRGSVEGCTSENTPEEDVYGDGLDMSELVLSPMVTDVSDKTIWNWKELKKQYLMKCITRPAHSNENSKKPPVPKNFLEVLKDVEHLEYFRSFIIARGGSAETQLQCWLAVEDMKNSAANKKLYQCKMKRIKKRFFGKEPEAILKCCDPIIYQLGSTEKPSPFQLLAAQAVIAETLERNWYKDYLSHLEASDSKQETKEEAAMLSYKERSKCLWSMFTHNVISFRRGLMHHSTAEMFRAFLRDEVIKASSSGPKKVIGTKVVNVTKLLNDLDFWAEVERYKDLADLINSGKGSGAHTPEDDIMVHKKAHAIVNCFIDSAVYPRVQINIAPELVTYILDSISQGEIFRGLFHEAALNIFSILILYWKKFCVVRFAPKTKHPATVIPSSTTVRGERRRSSVHDNHKENRRMSKHAGKLAKDEAVLPSLSGASEHTAGMYYSDLGPIISFSLSNGLRLVYPGQYHHYVQLEDYTQYI